MNIIKLKKLFIGAVILFSCFAGSCDRTVLSGNIVSDKSLIRPGESLKLDLKVPARFESVYGIMWKAIPLEGAEVLTRKENRENNGDRTAYFTASRPGTYEIRAYGFFKQTNPQFIARTFIVVTE